MSPFVIPAGMLEARFQEPQREVVEQRLIVEWNRKRVELKPKRLIFTEGVVARYDGIVCKANSITLYLEESEGYGIAEGDVELIDVDGTLKASKFVFNWREGTGSATDATGHAFRFMLSARTATVEPNIWKLEDASFTPCHGEERPLIRVDAKAVEVTSGRNGIARNPSFYLWGRKVLELPSYRFAVGPRRKGLALPNVSLSRNAELGVSWSPTFAIGRSTGASVLAQWFSRSAIGGAIELGYSPGAYRLPQNTFSERFAFGYFQNVNARSIAEESAFEGEPHLGFSVGAALRQSPPARRSQDLYTAPFDFGFGAGGRVGAVDGSAYARYQRIGRDGGPYLSRSTLGASALTTVNLRGAINFYARADAQTFLQPGRDFAWALGTVGVQAEFKPVRFGLALGKGAEWGSPALAIDPLFSKNHLLARVDLTEGPAKVAFLSKYDLDTKRWFDHEVAWRQVAGCLEPYIVWRKFPNSLNFGLRLRTDELFEAIDRRLKRRTP